MPQVVPRPGQEVVDSDDPISFRQKPIRQVRTQKARRTGDHDSHTVTRPILA